MAVPTLRLSPLLFFPVLLTACGGTPPSASGPASVVLVTIDTLRADRVGCYGDAEAATPMLDRLAGRGVRFDQAVAPAPLTLPSHATIFTGRYPPGHGVRNNGMYALPGEAVTLAEILAGEGYRTGAFIGAYPVASPFGLSQGFEVYDESFGPSGETTFRYSERPAMEVTRVAERWLRSIGPDQPLFAWVHYFDPHANYAPPPPYDSRFAGRPYAGEIAYTDAALSDLLDALDEGGRMERTIVIVTSDHGEGLGDHGEATHGIFVYESTLRVPLIVSPPASLRIPAGRVIREPVSLADILPTVLELIGVDPPEGVQGDSLVPLMTGARPDAGHEARRPIYAESLLPRLEFGWAELRAVRRGASKLIDAPRPELYDLASDPAEGNDLSAVRPAVVESLRTELGHTERALAGGGGPAPQRELTAEEVARLRSLGYLQGGLEPGGPEEARRAPRRDPKDGMPLLNRIEEGKALASRGLLDRSAEVLSGVLAEEPDNIIARWRLAEVLIAADRPAEADSLLRGMAGDGPEMSWLPGLRARALEALGRTDEALALYREAVDREPDPTQPAIRAALLLREAGRADDALSIVEEALSAGGGGAALYELAGDLTRQAGDPVRAGRHYVSALAADPRLDTAWSSLARVAFAGPGAIDEPAKLRGLAGEAGDVAGAHLVLGLLALTGGDPSGAIGPLRRAKEIDPADPDVGYFLGVALLETGDLGGAESVLAPLVTARPSMFQAYRALGMVKERQGRREEAVRLFREAVRINPQDGASRAALERLGAS